MRTLGDLSFGMGQGEDALSFHFAALQQPGLSEHTKLTLYSRIGNDYLLLEQFEEGQQFKEKYLALAIELDDTQEQVSAHNSLVKLV